MAGLFEGKVALVTGAGSGIGRASALAFAGAGAKVAVADVMVEGGHETLSMIRNAGGEAIFVKTDVSKAAEVVALVEAVISTYGRLDCAHNNAGIEGRVSTVVGCDEDDWDRVVSIDLKGVWLCMKYEIPRMSVNGGAIVNTSSVAGLVGVGSNPAYTASKHGVAGLTKHAALECAKTGIRVNAVCPSAIRTPMIERSIASGHITEERLGSGPLGRPGTAEEVAAAVLWLCSPHASFITGHVMPVDGGMLAR